MKSSPAFQFYPADFLADENVALMSLAGRGAYITLICYCWREGSIPADMNRMGRLCGIDSLAMAELWTELYLCFSKHEDRFVNVRLEKERMKQIEHSRERKESGQRGAETRWSKAKPQKTKDNHDNSSAIAQPIAKTIAEPIAVNSSSSSSSSSVEEESRSHSQSSRSRRSNVCDEEYLEELQKNPAYKALNVQALFHKMVAWCQVKGKQPTRARLVNWLNREDQPMTTTSANGTLHIPGRETPTHYADGREKPAGMKNFVC